MLYAMLDRGVELWARHGHLLAAVEEASHHDPEVERAYRAAFERSVESSATMLAKGVENGHYVVEPRPLARALPPGAVTDFSASTRRSALAP